MQSENTQPIATRGQRFLSVLIDLVAIYFLNEIVMRLFYFFFVHSDKINWPVQIHTHNVLSLINSVFLFVLYILYYIILEYFNSGRTLGKVIAGTKAVPMDGNKISFLQAASRTLFRFIPFECFTFFGDKGQPLGWHDRFAKTKVVSVREV